MSNYVSVIFCRNCYSRYVEISEWSENSRAIIHCRTCGASEDMGKFTLGRCMVSNSELGNARESSARSKKYER